MAKILPIAVMVFVLFSSCSTYQYTTISSSNMSMNEKQELVFENDSVRIIYNFNGHDGPVNITVQNKLQVPVYIDWQKSAIITEGRAVSYVSKEVKIEGGVQSSSAITGGGGSAYGISSGNISAIASLPPSIDFIPPQSYFTRNPMGLRHSFIAVPESHYHKLKYAATETYTVPVKAAVYTEESSPYKFRSYLTIMVGEVTAKPVGFEHSFFASQIMATGKPPGLIWLNKTERGNQFYVDRATSGGAAAGGVVLGLAAGAIMVGAAAQAANSTGN